MITLLIATRNQHKTQEIRAVLGSKFQYLTLNDFPSAPPVDETGVTFAENAAKKSTELATWLAANRKQLAGKMEEKLLILADDSGLEVDALNGAPGVYSARFAAMDTGAPGNSPDAANNAKLLRSLEGVPAEKRTARFRCTLALTQLSFLVVTGKPMISTKIFDGVCEGKIKFAASGNTGFGYDPLFTPEGHTQSFAELGEKEKNKISHRARALQALEKYLSE